MGRHDGRVALVTGAASGIGRAAVELMVAEGASVVAVDRVDDFDWLPARAVASIGSVTDPAANEAAVKLAQAEFGGLDVAFLNAGVPGSVPIADAGALAIFDQNWEVNVRGVVLGMQAAIPALRERGGGAIVVTASTSGIGGDPGMWPYNTAKGAVLNLVRSVAVEVAHEKIRVNSVCPGPTVTGMTRPVLERGDWGEQLRRRIPMQRWGEARELAAAVSFLASDEASFITGAHLPVDGGITANTGQFLPPQADTGE